MKILREGNAYVFNVIRRKLYTKLSVKNLFSCTKWRIQDFPDGGGANPSHWGANLLFSKFFSRKLHKNLKSGRGRGRVPSAPSFHPHTGSAKGTYTAIGIAIM